MVGVIPGRLADKRVAHEGLDELHVVETMHARKALMADLSDAFIALPGGFGTTGRILRNSHLGAAGISLEACWLASNFEGFFDPVLSFVDHAIQEGFVRVEQRKLILVAGSIEELLDRLGSRASANKGVCKGAIWSAATCRRFCVS